jgi:hypothetical protein
MYKLCDVTEYTYVMRIYLGKDRQNAVQRITATHATVTYLTRKAKWVGYKVYMDNFFYSPDLCDELHTKGINYCETVSYECKGMLGGGFDNKTLQLKQVDILARVRGNLTAKIWKEK